MEIIKPKKLIKGNTIGILAVSGRIKEYENLEKAKYFFENCGYNVVISETCKHFHRYMAGKNDEECVKELHNFFLNDKIDAILCARGGFGTLRLVNKINWNIIKRNPKIFAGYSDITILLNMIYKKTGLITFHSAMPNGDFSNVIEEYTKNSFFSLLKGKKFCYSAKNKIVYKEGQAIGRLWGGNLASLVSLCGLDFIPNEDLILFLEDLNEPAYKIDRMLTQLFNIRKIRKNVKGIVLGEFENIDNNELLNEILKELTKKLNIPVCCGFKITHGKIKDSLPLGAFAKFDSSLGKLIIEEEYTMSEKISR